MIFIVIIMIITVSGVMVVVEGNIQWCVSHFRVSDPVAAAAVCLDSAVGVVEQQTALTWLVRGSVYGMRCN